MKNIAQIVAFLALVLAAIALYMAQNTAGQPQHTHDTPVANETHSHGGGDLPNPTANFRFVLSDQFPTTAGDADNNVHVTISAPGQELTQSNSVCFLARVTGGYNDNSHTASVEPDGNGWRIHLIGANISARAGCLVYD